MKKGNRYNKEIWEEAFQRWHKGESETSIANDPKMPSRQSINAKKIKNNWRERSDKIKKETLQKIDKKLSDEDFKHYKITDIVIGHGLKKKDGLKVTGDTILKAIETQRRILGKDKLQIEAKVEGALTMDDFIKVYEEVLKDGNTKRRNKKPKSPG